MPRMKLTKDEFNPDKLNVKVEPSKFKRYRGEIPKNGTILIFRVTRMWWTQAKDGTSQIYLIAIAEQNTGALKQFNGLPIKEYLTFKEEAAFRYMNFLNNFGLTTRMIFSKLMIEDKPDSIGDIITAIGPWVVGSDDALCRIALVRDRYDPDELKAKADRDGWLPYDEADEADEDDEDLDDEDEDDEDIDEDDEDLEDEEEDEPPARPTKARRGRTSQAKASSRTRRQARPEPEDEDEDDEDIDDEEDEEVDDYDDEEAEEDEAEDEDEEEADEEEEPPARPARRSRNAGRTASKSRPAASSTGRRGSSRSSRSDGERTRSRTSTARTERTPGPRGSKGRDGGSREDPPF